MNPTTEYLAVRPEAGEAPPPSPRGLLRLRQQLETGLPLTPRPYETLAEHSGLSEGEVINAIRQWQAQGLIKRLGLVVRHRTLGYTSNAMVVWDIPDNRVRDVGRVMAGSPIVTLCYRRPRRLPDWPYNLFCMIHGISRERVLTQLGKLIREQQLERFPHSVLFSSKAYKQRGGCYVGHD